MYLCQIFYKMLKLHCVWTVLVCLSFQIKSNMGQRSSLMRRVVEDTPNLPVSKHCWFCSVLVNFGFWSKWLSAVWRQEACMSNGRGGRWRWGGDKWWKCKCNVNLLVNAGVLNVHQMSLFVEFKGNSSIEIEAY